MVVGSPSAAKLLADSYVGLPLTWRSPGRSPEAQACYACPRGDAGYPSAMTHDQFAQQDPTEQHAAPGSGDQTIEHPGRTGEMDVRPDHGEETYRGTGRLEGKKAVITGGDSGIGRAVAIAFAREGADVLITHLEAEKDDAEETARWVREAGRSVVTMPTDVIEEQNCREIVERAVRELGGIDVLVSNAAYQMSQDGGIDDITTEQFDRVLKTNVYALFWLCKAAVPHMRPGSVVITTSSVQAFQPSPHLLDYATSKAAIVNFTKALGANLADRGIRGELGGSRAGVDPVDPVDDGREEAGVVRSAGTDGPGGAARGAGPVLRVPRLAGVALHDLGGIEPFRATC